MSRYVKCDDKACTSAALIEPPHYFLPVGWDTLEDQELCRESIQRLYGVKEGG